MAYSDYYTGAHLCDTLADVAMSGGRAYIVDGKNPNLVLTRNEKDTRIMGAFPSPSDPVATNAGSGTALPAGQYQYAVVRVVTAQGFVIRSDYMLSNILTSNGKDGVLTFDSVYEFPPPAGATWTIVHRIYRSKKDALTLLYKVVDKADGSGSSPYTDSTVDGSLDATDTLDISDTSADYSRFLPPVRFIRNWNDQLVAAGTFLYGKTGLRGTVTVADGDKDLVTLSSDGHVQWTDIGAYLEIEGEGQQFVITGCNPTNNTWDISPACAAARTAVAYGLYRTFNTIYLCNPLGQQYPEAYADPDGEIAGDERTGDPITGLACNNGLLYVFHRRKVELLETGGSGQYRLRPLLGCAGCASHATIADSHSPAVFWYAGEAGVWMANGTDVRKISGDLDELFDTGIDHSMDNLCHAVYDPVRMLYMLWTFAADWHDEDFVRVPQQVLVYDLQRQQWYKWKLAASRATVINVNGKHTVAVGLAGSLATLDWEYASDVLDMRFHYGSSDSYGSKVLSFSTSTRPTGDDGSTTETWANLPTSGPGCAGLPVHITRYGTDGSITATQRRIIRSNTASTITLWKELDWTPASGDEITVGGIYWEAELQDVNLLPDWHTEKTAVTEVEALVEPGDTQYLSKLTLQLAGERTKTQDKKAGRDLYGKELLVFTGAEICSHARSVIIRLFGNTVKSLKIYALRVLRGAPTKRK